MARNVQLLLLENVDGTGIVGDVVNVRKGFARNFLLPRNIATTPDAKLIAELKVKRKDAIKNLGVVRKQREELIAKLSGIELTLIRPCNDLGILYGAITQHDLAMELAKAGYKGIIDREVRIGVPIKRVGDYPVTVKFSMAAIPDEDGKGKIQEASSVEAEIKVHIKADRDLDMGRGKDEPSDQGAEGEQMQKREKNKAATFATDKPKADKPVEAGEKKAEKKSEKKADAKPEGKAEKKAEPKAEKKAEKKK